MARIRSVHPSLFTDEAWVSCSPLARLLYIGLWTDADDQGLFEWKPLQIKMRLLPGDAADVPELLAELVDVNLIAALEAGGKRLGAIRYFRRFQRPKKPNSLFVLPPEWVNYVGLSPDDPEPDGGERPPVPNQFGTGGEKSPQMEDGGGRIGEEGEADASLSPEPTKPKAYPDLFEAAWKAYPHVKGRSSKQDTLAKWRRLTDAQREALPRAAAAYAKDGREPKMDCGAPAMDRWLKGGKFEDWIGSEPGAGGADWPDSRWLVAVGLWRSEGAWGESLGPPPGQPGCRVPPHLLIQPTANGSAA